MKSMSGVSLTRAESDLHATGVRPIGALTHGTGDTRIAAIDVGSNSVRQIVADVSTEGAISVVDEMKAAPRLATGLESSGKLDDMPGGVWRTGPALGEDNELVYSSWLGVPPEELERLREADVV